MDERESVINLPSWCWKDVEKIDNRQREEINRRQEQILLFNPSLDYWLISDNIRRVKIPLGDDLSALDLVKSVAAAVIDRINSNRLETLLNIANLPVFLNSPGKKESWERVKKQLSLLVELLSTDTPPGWLKPIMEIEKPGYLLTVIHSRLFMPANWLFPLWQKDYGDYLLETNKKLYLSMYPPSSGNAENVENVENAKKWIIWLHLLLIHREALWRFITKNGGYIAGILLPGIKKAGTGDECPLLFSMRLLSEYLDIKTDTGIPPAQIEEKFTELWEQLKVPHDISFKAVDGNVEIIGFEETLTLFPGLETRLFDLRRILKEYILGSLNERKSPLAWINFNVLEIEKRIEFFQEALNEVGSDSTFEGLKEIGIHVQIDCLDNVLVFTVEPDKWAALKDRIPEVTDEERGAIRADNYSAVAIFDTLLKNKLEKTGKEPIWMPRVYRILDTMADFDPLNVQPLTISFQAEEKIKDVQVYLPIPGGTEDPAIQAKRKEITARYMVILIYNYVVTLGIYSAAVDCSPLGEQKQSLGFKNDELENMISGFARELGYEQLYGTYLENFNFKKFSIKSAFSPREKIEFTERDITSYGLFLGIDIGGTDTKVSLFRKGEVVAFGGNRLFKFKTIDPTMGSYVPVEKFCRRIIAEVEAGFKNEEGKSAFNWEELDGIGISWPGAVRDSNIIAFSGTLQHLSFEKDGKTKTFNSESSPHDIHSLDLAGVFFKEIPWKDKNVSKSFVVAIENDGNAEAYGNYCNLEKNKNDEQRPGGKLILKLGTSLAGGHVNVYGAISPQMTEFSKITLDFNTKGSGAVAQGAAREFVSSKGVRNLSRTFRFEGEPVFGQLDCQCCHAAMNASDNQDTRIEAVEIGQMLNFFKYLEEDLKDNFLKELVEMDNRYPDNQYPGNAFKEIKESLVTQLQEDKNLEQELKTYIKERGEEEFNRHHRNSKTDKSESFIRHLGISRLRLLLQLEPSPVSPGTEQIPGDINYETLARKILGSAALLSQLGAHIAHLVVVLFNIYKKKRFSEVILAGGVLRGETGDLVVRQAEAFLAKYYDKIFGPDKHLKPGSKGTPGSVRLAPAVENPDTVGPFGAAMVANRLHKMNSLAVMEKEIDYRVRNLKPGDSLPIENLKEAFGNSRLKEEDIRGYLETLVSQSVLLQQSIEEELYVKALNPG